MHRAITWIASLLALALMVGLPLGYFLQQRAAIQDTVRHEAEASAQTITSLVQANPELWRFQAERLEQVLAQRPGDGTPEARHLHDTQDRVVASSAQALDGPLVSVGAPVFDAGREVGRVEVVRSLWPTVMSSGLVALLAAALAGAVFAALRLMPLRALSRAEKQARDLAERTALLEQAHRDAVAEARLKTHFLARLTHEIRTPLGGLLGMTESLRDAPMDATQRLRAHRAHESSAALLQVVNDILEYSRAHGSDLVVAHEQFDPIPLVEGVIELMTPQAAASGLTLYYEVGPGLPAVMEGDPGRLRQVLSNLVSNAVKFTPRGDVKVNVKWNAATPSVPASIYFEVRDTGVGISPEQQAKLFQPLPDVDLTLSRSQGAGMGLTISRQLVESMGGRMGLLSTPGQGSRFWFDLPQKQAQFPLSPTWPTDAAGAPLHALVADPHIGRARAMCSRLMALGLRVNAVHNAPALRAVLAKPGLRFTHVLALGSLGVSPTEARWMNWITMVDSTVASGKAGAAPAAEGVVLSLPCRRDELIELLTQGQAQAMVSEVPRVIEMAPKSAPPVAANAPVATATSAPAAGTAAAPIAAAAAGAVPLQTAMPPARPAPVMTPPPKHASGPAPQAPATDASVIERAVSARAAAEAAASAAGRQEFAAAAPLTPAATPSPVRSAPTAPVVAASVTATPPAAPIVKTPVAEPAAVPVDRPVAAPPPEPADRLPDDEIDTVTDPVLDVDTITDPVLDVEEPSRMPIARLAPTLPSVLLVESHAASQEMGRLLLESMGCLVQVADDGHEALQRVPDSFGLILLDLQLNGMDAFTTANEIRRWESAQQPPRRTPLVALTADESGEVRQRCVACGIDDIIGKPVDRRLLRETLERYLPMLVPA